ncbi:MAG TPA: exo-alpha-sialidase [Bacteroidia bacterium]|jgi:hypothetical protein|nr:exo-alpha-sialidase [Bacteroidia bacterium]
MKTNLRDSVKTLTLVLLTLIFPSLLYAQWSAPADISPGAISAFLNESMGTCIGVSGDTLHVVYADKHSTKNVVINYTHSVDTGKTWSAPVPITSLTGYTYNPAIAVNGRNVHVVWRVIDTLTGKRASWYKHSTDGGNTWGPNVFLDSTADWPAVAVSGANVYMANDVVTSNSPYNTEIFFMRSTDNGVTWGPRKQLTFAIGRSEDEAIIAQGSHIHMSWNDNRGNIFQIFYKESSDYGVTWDSDVVVMPKTDYGTMVSIDGAHTDVIATGHPTSNHYQVLLAQSADTGKTWASDKDITNNDTAHTYYYPDMVRNGNDLHVVTGSSIGAEYLHSGNGGSTWDPPFQFTGGSTFVAYTGCALHIICINASHVYYLRNPTGNAGHCSITSVNTVENSDEVKVYPNPFTTKTTIEFSSSQKMEGLKLGVFDVLGHELVTTTFDKDNRVILGRDGLNSGIYFYRIFQNGTVIASGKLAVE